jgi:succinate dehydrogenase subunit C
MRQPYQRPIDKYWWAKSPYLGYTLREATGIAVALYALVLLAGVTCLATSENAYRAWLGFLASRWSIAFHALILIGMLFHVWTWFGIMPKTMPRLVIGGRYIEPRLITAAGIAIASLASLLLLLIIRRVSQ